MAAPAAVSELVENIWDPELHVPSTDTNRFSLTDKQLSPEGNLSGWYSCEVYGLGIAYVQDKIDMLTFEIYSNFNQGKKYYLDRSTPTVIVDFIKHGDIYTDDDSTTPTSLKYNPVTKEFVNTFDGVTTAIAGFVPPLVFRLIPNPDSRMWKYKFALEDPAAVFNSFTKMFDLMKNHSQTGRLSGFTVKSNPEPVLNINPYNVDYTKLSRSFGAYTPYQYQALYETLLYRGVERFYTVRRAIYWPEPGSALELTDQERADLRWYVNQQRYQFLAFVFNLPEQNNLNSKEFVRLCPGERVKMTGSGTRFDNIPLRLSIIGTRSGPRPAAEFCNSNFYDDWTFYTLRLPLLITNENDKIYYRAPTDVSDQVFTIPLGNYYTNDLIDYINVNFPVPSFVEIDGDENSSRKNIFSFFSVEGASFNSPNKIVNPSTFFGAAGWDVGYLFPLDVKIVGFDLIVFETSENNPTKYRVHTPLTTDEARSILNNLDNIVIGAVHGPVSDVMEPDNFNACMLELSLAASTEAHALVIPWTRKSDSRIDELYYSNEKLFADLNRNAPLTYDVLFNPTDFNGSAPGDLRYAYLRLPGCGHPGGFSEFYKTGAARDPVQQNNRQINRIQPLNPGNLLFYPDNTKVRFPPVVGPEYDLSHREVEIPIVNYLEDPRWLATTRNTAIGATNGSSLTVDNGAAAGTYSSIWARYGSFLKPSGLSGKIVLANPVTANGMLTNGAAMLGNIALVIRGGVTAAVKTKNCQNAGAIAVIIYNTPGSGFPPLAGSDPTITIPTIGITNAVGVAIRNSLLMGDVFCTMRAVNSFNNILIPYADYESQFSTNPNRPDDQVTIQAPNLAAGVYNARNAAFGLQAPAFDAANFHKIVAAIPIEANPPINGAALNGNIAIIKGSNTTPFIEQVKNCQNVGAIAVIVINNNPNGIFLMQGTDPEITIASAMISLADGNTILAALDLNTMGQLSARVINEMINPGEYVIGIVREDRVREILGVPVGAVPKFGYITHSVSESGVTTFGSGNDVYQDTPQAGLLRGTTANVCAFIIQYFNTNGVQHFFGDIRNTLGGQAGVPQALPQFLGNDRFYRYGPSSQISSIQTFDQSNGFIQYSDNLSIQRQLEIDGVVTYRYINTIRDCKPSLMAKVFDADAFFGGPPPVVIPGYSTQRNVFWITNESSISSPQGAYMTQKSTSIAGAPGTNIYNGNFGNNVQYVGYGIYDRTFSTGGSYTSYLNWYSKGRKSAEELEISPMFSIDRFEVSGSGPLYDGPDENNAVMNSSGQDFIGLQQPNILWNMEADIFYQDIGYTKDNGVNIGVYGEPWVEKRYNGIVYTDALTWKDTTIIKMVTMAVDPNLNSHFFVNDNYGNLKA